MGIHTDLPTTSNCCLSDVCYRGETMSMKRTLPLEQ